LESIPNYLPLQIGIIYGPVNSRRLGSSLGVNHKLCGFNCIYCQYGPTKPAGYTSHSAVHDQLPAPADVEESLRSVLELYPDVQYITFSGNGEATLHPRFPEMVERVVSVRDALAPNSKTAILSNSTGIAIPDVRDALMKLDKPIMKLDAGTDELFRRINRPHPDFSFERVIAGLKELEHPGLTIQTMFFSGDPTNIEENSIEAWCEILKDIKASDVQIYSIERASAESGIYPVALQILKKIAKRAEDITGLPVRAY
jgi:wyosine [tRNA(Phe)-imidazoG37] synthetase (radical SAM superfamily)